MRVIGKLLGLVPGVIAILLVSCTGEAASGNDNEAAEVRQIAERFGTRLKTVSVLAPDTMVADQIREAYGTLVTPELLRSWVENPSAAPGRTVSSPWPERIEVRDVREVQPGIYSVDGDVVYVTSVEMAEGGAAAREPVVLRVERGQGHGWRIADVESSTAAAES